MMSAQMLQAKAHTETIVRGRLFKNMLNAIKTAENDKNSGINLLDFFILFAYTKDCKVLGAFPPLSLALTAYVGA